MHIPIQCRKTMEAREASGWDEDGWDFHDVVETQFDVDWKKYIREARIDHLDFIES